MKRQAYAAIIAVLLLALVAVIGWAAGYTPQLTPSASEEWSRGRLVGDAPVSVPVDIQVASDHDVFLTWVDTDERMHIARVGTQGQVISDRVPGVGAGIPREPRFVVGPGGEIHLVWLETSGGRSVLTYARLDSAISVRAGPLPLSLQTDTARSPHLAFGRLGQVEVYWSGEAGIYHASVTTAGQLQSEAELLVEGGDDVSVQVDRDGLFHLAWQESMGANLRSIYYATFDAERKQVSEPEEIGTVFLRTGQRIESLTVGLDSTTGYVLWTVQDRRDVSSRAWYAFFPLGMPGLSRTNNLALEEGGDPLSLWAAPTQNEVLVLALSETIMTEDGPLPQICLIMLEGGQIPESELWAAAEIQRSTSTPDGRSWSKEEYVVTASGRPSLKPSLAIDASRNLHLAWLQTGGFGTYHVAYASTAPGVRQSYNALTLWDVVDRVFGLAMNLFMVVGFTPVLAICWTLLPLVWLGGYHFVTGYETVETSSGRVALGLAIVLEVLSTYLVYPYRSMMPVALQWTMPLATSAVGALLAWVYLRRRDEGSLFGAFFVFALVHGLLQVALFIAVRC
ncbi:MAG: hypothetical protein AB1449_01595 [Chloroflexota bacterium]